MNGYVELEDLDAIAEMEDIEMDEAEEAEDILERRRRTARFRQPPRTAPGGGLFRPRPTPGPGGTQYVTQTQLQAALARVGQQIKTNSDAVKTLNTRVATLSTDVTRQAADLKKEQAIRKRETDGLKRELKQTRELSAILPLLSAPRSFPVDTQIGPSIPVGTRVVVDSGDALTSLLPFFLLSSAGGAAPEGGGGGLGGDMLLPLVLILGRR